MNHDDNKTPDLQTWIEPELEARIVAAVLGEASAFEIAELERLTAEKPELAIFKRRIEAVHGLVGLAARPEQAPLHLAPARRAKILQTIGAMPARPAGVATNAPVLLALAANRRKRRKRWIWASGLAASVMFAAFMALREPSTPPIFGHAQVHDEKGGRIVNMIQAFDAPGMKREMAAKAEEDVAALSPFEVSKKPSMLDKLRKSLTSPAQSESEPSAAPAIVSLQETNSRQHAAQEDRAREMESRTSLTRKSVSTPMAEEMAAGRYERQTETQRSRGLQAGGARDDGSVQYVPSLDRVFDDQATLAGKGGSTHQWGYAGTLAVANEKKVFDAPANPPAGPAPADENIVALEPFKVVAAKEGMAQAISQQRISINAKNVVAADQFGEIAEGNAADYLKFIPSGKPDANKRAVASADTSFIQPTEAAPNPLQPAAAPSTNSGGELFVLSPFSVSRAKDKGYTTSSTLAGSRLNSKLEDIASSITVVTKQQLADTASTNINDVFLFEASTEGNRASVDRKEADVATNPAMEDERLSREKAEAAAAAASTPTPKPQDDAARGEIRAAKEPVSTFSLHVSDVSFRLAQAALARGETPDPDRIRPEEFYNAFDYGDPSPATTDKIFCRIEQAAHPLLQQRNLVRIAMKVPSSGRGAGQPLHLTVLLDTSGSMEREDRIASVHRALEVLASLLGANDRVTLIGFARQPRLLAEQLPGDQAAKLAELASQTPFTGGTNLEAALKLAGELARRYRDPAAQNRIVLVTDGAANLGNADPAQFATMIETLRQQGIAFDACGVGTDGLDDAILEALTRKGDGRYYVLDKPEEADAGFARQLAGAFRPAAENVKVQVRFNPARVGSYRLIGFEQHRLREEDFRNDKVDAAELAADEAAVALYQVEVLPQGEGELGEVSVRFRDAATGSMVERSWTMLHEPRALAFDRATPTMQLAGTAALLAEKLRGGEAANLINLADLTPVVNSLRGHYANDARVQELIAMFEQLRRRAGK